MAFTEKDKKLKNQVSLNSFSGAVSDAVKTVAHHVKGATPFANSELKHKMQHKSGRAIDN